MGVGESGKEKSRTGEELGSLSPCDLLVKGMTDEPKSLRPSGKLRTYGLTKERWGCQRPGVVRIKSQKLGRFLCS